jgi:hypothetical protein
MYVRLDTSAKHSQRFLEAFKLLLHPSFNRTSLALALDGTILPIQHQLKLPSTPW